jgi:hypothetical protein
MYLVRRGSLLRRTYLAVDGIVWTSPLLCWGEENRINMSTRQIEGKYVPRRESESSWIEANDGKLRCL